jgi:hypothetical protein
MKLRLMVALSGYMRGEDDMNDMLDLEYHPDYITNIEKTEEVGYMVGGSAAGDETTCCQLLMGRSHLVSWSQVPDDETNMTMILCGYYISPNLSN